MQQKHEKLAERLVNLIIRLNDGERLNIDSLTTDYQVSKRTIQRDFNRLSILNFAETGQYYRLDNNKQGYLGSKDIQRFASFASIQELLPELDRKFFLEHLQRSVLIKGFEYEDVKHRKDEFAQINHAIETGLVIEFDYRKVRKQNTPTKHHRLEPYQLLNKNGIWYVVGVKQGQQRIYCFTQISNLRLTETHFDCDEQVKAEIEGTDSLFFGNRIGEIVLQVSHQVAGYFERRNLLPNQETVRKLDNGDLLLASKQVHPREVMPIVQYWIPHIRIISPSGLQGQMEGIIGEYLNK